MSETRKIAPVALLDMVKLRAAAPIKQRLDLFDVFGIITDRKPKLTEYGQCMTYLGRFEAVVVAPDFALTDDIAAGVVVRGDKAFFPPELEALIDAAFPAKGRANIQLGVRIGVGPVPHGQTVAAGYVWVIEPLVKPSESNAVTMLREHVSAGRG